MKTPTIDQIDCIFLEATCAGITKARWDKLMQGATRADKRTVNRIVRVYLPDLYQSLALHLNNPYKYYKTETHLVLVHSEIEYFMPYSLRRCG
jgi:hypothetical protein